MVAKFVCKDSCDGITVRTLGRWMESLVPPYAYALGSALLWAISVPILNVGIRRFPAPASSAALVGLLVSLSVGTITLGLFAYPIEGWHVISAGTLTSGVFTYSIGTGLYYMTSFSFGARTEIASQFAKIKPLFSLVIAVVLLGEVMTPSERLAASFVIAGVIAFLIGAARRVYSYPAVVLGLLTALSWAIGEAFVKLSFPTGQSIDHAFVALATGTLVVWGMYPIARRLGTKAVSLNASWLWPFAVHGVISFAIAYTMFFHSIATLGLLPTVVINAFWPFMSIILTQLIPYAGSSGRRQVPLAVWVASGLLLLGSLIEIISSVR